MPALFSLHRAGFLPAHFKVVGYARSRKDDSRFRAGMRRAVEEFGQGDGDGPADELIRRDGRDRDDAW